jgi:hypothetical protein
MKISRKSWHYQLISLVGWDHPSSLCAYFWCVVFAPFKVLWVVFCVTALVAIAAGPVAQFFVDRAFVWALAGGVIDVVALTATLVILVRDRRDEERYERMMRGDFDQQRKPREPSLLTAWLRAVHERVCPMLEFDR